MRKLYNTTVGAFLLICTLSFLQAGDISKPVNQFCLDDHNRNFVVSQLAEMYPIEVAYAAEAEMHQIMSKRGLTSLDMLTAMWIECRFDYQAVNKHTGAYGVIQFMPRTCAILGVSYARLTTAYGLICQIKLADVYFRYAEAIASNQITRTEDLYCAVLAPARIGQELLYAYGTKAYKLNRCLNMVYGDHGLSQRDLRTYIYNVVPFADRIRTLNWCRTDYTIAIETQIRMDINPYKYRPTYSPTEFMYFPVVDRV